MGTEGGGQGTTEIVKHWGEGGDRCEPAGQEGGGEAGEAGMPEGGGGEKRAAGNRGKIVGRVEELKRNSRRGKFNKKRRETGVFLAQHPRKMYLPQIKNQKDNMFSIWERKKKCNETHDYY